MVARAAIDATIDAYLAAFTAGERAAWLACFAEHAWIEDPVGTPRHAGRSALGAFWDEQRAVADGIELRPLGLRVVIESVAEAAFTMQARPRVGDQIHAIDIVDVMTFDGDGSITTMRAFYDPSSMRPADP